MVTFYDLGNKLIAGSFPVKDVVGITDQSGVVVVVRKGGKITKFFEKELISRIQLLFQKNLYDIAAKYILTHPSDPCTYHFHVPFQKHFGKVLISRMFINIPYSRKSSSFLNGA